jgi:hypothetical protein
LQADSIREIAAGFQHQADSMVASLTSVVLDRGSRLTDADFVSAERAVLRELNPLSRSALQRATGMLNPAQQIKWIALGAGLERRPK